MIQIEAQKLLPLIQALAEAKIIQMQGPDGNWEDVYNPSFQSDRAWRVKPESVLRPWKLQEIPVGGLIRFKDPKFAQPPKVILTATCMNSDLSFPTTHPAAVVLFFNMDVRTLTAPHLLDSWEFMWPGGFSWSPCGVLEDPK